MKRHGWLAVFIVFTALSTISLQAQDVPFVGVITQDNTQLRAGAGQPFYVVGDLDTGDFVTVREVIVGWHRIDAPEGVHSYVSKMNVDARADGKAGTINTDRTPVTAARSRGTGPSYQTQVELAQGEPVTIVGEQGSFYKIIPPAKATVFIAPGGVRAATPAEIRAFQNKTAPVPPGTSTKATSSDEETATETVTETATETTAETVTETASETVAEAATETTSETITETEQVVETSTDNAGETMTETVTVTVTETVTAGQDTAAESETVAESTTQAATEAETATETATVTTATETETVVEGSTEVVAETATVAVDMSKDGSEPVAPATDALSELEARMLPLFMKPVEEQPIDEMVLAYKQLSLQRDLSRSDRRIIAMRLVALERNRKLASALRGIAEARKQAQAGSEAVVEMKRQTEIKIQEAAAKPPTRYDLVGRLTGSSVYDGRDLPVMFRLVDPGTGRTIGYLHPNDVAQHKELIGRRIGIVGDVTYDPALQINLIHADRIMSLE